MLSQLEGHDAHKGTYKIWKRGQSHSTQLRHVDSTTVAVWTVPCQASFTATHLSR